MKRIILWLTAVVLLVACEKNEITTEGGNVGGENVKTKTFSFTIKGDFDGELKTKAILSSNGTPMTDLWMLDYMADGLQQAVHLTNADEGFNEPKVTLDYGSHHIYIVVSRGLSPMLDVDAGTITWNTPSDTFWKDYAIDVTANSSKNRSCTLARVATQLRVTVDDEVPTGVVSLSVMPAKMFHALAYMTGGACDARGSEYTFPVPESYVGTFGQLGVAFISLSENARWMSDVVVTAKGADGNSIGSVTMTDIPFVRNKATEVSCKLFSGGSHISLGIADEWADPDNEIW